MSDPNLPAPRAAGSSQDEQVKASHLSMLGEVRDAIARDFSDEAFAQRLGVTRKAIDVAVAGIDALFSPESLPQASTRRLGGAAAAEAAGYAPEDVNVAAVVGDKADSAPALPDPDEKMEILSGDISPVSEAAPDNMTTDPRVNPRLSEDGPGHD